MSLDLPTLRTTPYKDGSEKNEKLVYATFTMPINRQSIAGYVADTGQILNIENAYDLSPRASYRFDRHFDEASRYKTESMLTVPMKTGKDEILGILQVINARDENKKNTSFSIHAEKIMAHFADIAAVALERAQTTRDIILRMIRMAEMRDPKETGAHVNRVGAFSVEIYEQWARRRHLDKEQIDKNRDILRMAAMLHDVGKVGISDLILKKPGRFNREEYEIMKQHTLFGARLFDDPKSELDESAIIVALNHHEKWDGTGYPGYANEDMDTLLTDSPATGSRKTRGKAGKEIPIYGRIVALADVFDALSSVRVYKEAWDEKDVLETIQNESGKHFDPELVEIFFSILDVIRSIQKRFKDIS